MWFPNPASTSLRSMVHKLFYTCTVSQHHTVYTHAKVKLTCSEFAVRKLRTSWSISNMCLHKISVHSNEDIRKLTSSTSQDNSSGECLLAWRVEDFYFPAMIPLWFSTPF